MTTTYMDLTQFRIVKEKIELASYLLALLNATFP